MNVLGDFFSFGNVCSRILSVALFFNPMLNSFQFCACIVVRPSKHILFTVGRTTFVNFDSLNGLTRSKFLKGTNSTRVDFNYKDRGNKNGSFLLPYER